MLAVVIGGTGGIGAALVNRLLESDNFSLVVATWHQTPPTALSSDNEACEQRLVWMQLDARDTESVNAFASDLAAKLSRLPTPSSKPNAIGLVINTVGLLHDSQLQPEKSLRSFKASNLAVAMHTNCLPTLLLAQALGPLLKSPEPAVFASISARVGSISDNHLGGWYSYRISKAALNMAIRTLAVEWGRSHRNVCVAALHPGTTATALSEPFQKNVPPAKLFEADVTAEYLLQVVATLDATRSGRFWAYDGSEIPW